MPNGAMELTKVRHMRMMVVAASALLLGGCGGTDVDADGDGQISSLELEAVADQMVQPEPGQYRTTMTLVNFEMPGAPPQAAEMMRNMMNGRSVETCLTPEQAERGFEEMARNTQGSDCTYEKFEMNGSKMNAKAVCQGQNGPLTMEMSGTGGRTSSEMTVTTKGDMTGMGDGTITMRVQNERVGDCS